MNQPKPIEREAVAIIAIMVHEVLMVRNRKRGGSIEIPGGALLPGEGIRRGATRELFEECGLRADPEWLTWIHTKVAHDWRVYVVRALRWSGELRSGDDAESAFFGDPTLLLTGQRSEDYETVTRAMWKHDRKTD
jgi:8-oxo-dGTP pyrophosphatase MutT (NUDIX family)